MYAMAAVNRIYYQKYRHKNIKNLWQDKANNESNIGTVEPRKTQPKCFGNSCDFQRGLEHLKRNGIFSFPIDLCNINLNQTFFPL